MENPQEVLSECLLKFATPDYIMEPGIFAQLKRYANSTILSCKKFHSELWTNLDYSLGKSIYFLKILPKNSSTSIVVHLPIPIENRE